MEINKVFNKTNASIAFYNSKRIFRLYWKQAGLGVLFLLPAIALDYGNVHTKDVRFTLDIKIYFLRFCVGIGITLMKKSEEQEL